MAKNRAERGLSPLGRAFLPQLNVAKLPAAAIGENAANRAEWPAIKH
jgi:hypothetical protein